MINKGDTIKLVYCNLCGDSCKSYEGTYEVIRVAKPFNEHHLDFDVRGIDNTRSGVACASRVRKVYD